MLLEISELKDDKMPIGMLYGLVCSGCGKNVALLEGIDENREQSWSGDDQSWTEEEPNYGFES